MTRSGFCWIKLHISVDFGIVLITRQIIIHNVHNHLLLDFITFINEKSKELCA